MRSDIIPGAIFPDFELPDQTNMPRKLSTLQESQPMILTLSRGMFCPKEHRQHERLVEFYPEIKVGYTRLVTISTDDLVETNKFREQIGAQWPFLSDLDRIVQQDLDIQEYTDPVHNPMIPHTIVLEPCLKIYKIYNGYWGRPSTEELRMDLRDITRRIRPDWDITSPQLREAWKGDEEVRQKLFFPYRKRERLPHSH